MKNNMKNQTRWGAPSSNQSSPLKENQIEVELMSNDELSERFYAEHDCLSDDVDKEEARIERWAEQMGYQVTD